MPGSANPDVDLDVIIADIREAGERLTSLTDEVHHDEELEMLVPQLVRVLLEYEGWAAPERATSAKRAMIQIFDAVTRFVEDPTLLPG